MKQKIKVLVAILAITFSLTACKNNEQATPDVDTTVSQTDNQTQDTALDLEQASEQPEEQSTIIEIKLTVINNTNAELGAFSIVDPVSNEQINLPGVVGGEQFEVGLTWPQDQSIMNWAIYNTSGELYMESATKLDGITTALTLTLNGTDGINEVVTDVE